MQNKYLKSFIVIFTFILIALSVRNAVHAQFDPLEDFMQMIEGREEFQTGLQKFEGRPHGLSSVMPGADIITTVIFNVIDFIKYILGTIAILYITIGGIKLIIAGKDIDEVSERQKDHLKYILYGLFLAILADTLIQQVFFGEYGECVASTTNAQACAEEGARQLRGVYNFMEFFIGTVAVLIVVLSGFRLATSGGDEEAIKKQKKHIAVAIVGILLVAVSEFIIKDIFFPEAGTRPIDVSRGRLLVYQIINFISSFVVTLSILFLIYGGYKYVVSTGNEEETGKAKKIIIGAVIGILIAAGAFGIVRTVTSVKGRENQLNLPGASYHQKEFPKASFLGFHENLMNLGVKLKGQRRPISRIEFFPEKEYNFKIKMRT